MTGTVWGRAPRGRVWHHLFTGGALCDRTTPIAETNTPLPPRGGRPCPPCVRIIEELASNVAAAKVGATALRDGTGTLAADGVVDLDIVDAPCAHRDTHGYCQACDWEAAAKTRKAALEAPGSAAGREVEVVDLVGALRASVDAAKTRREARARGDL